MSEAGRSAYVLLHFLFRWAFLDRLDYYLA